MPASPLVGSMEDVISRTNIVALKSLRTLRTLDIGENVGNLSFRAEPCSLLASKLYLGCKCI